MKIILAFILHIILFLTAWVLIIPLSIINFILVRSRGYFLDSGASLDRWGNREFRTLFNKTLIKEEGHKFGLIEETISGVLGKNKLKNTLTKVGKILAYILDTIDSNHCIKSIDEKVIWVIIEKDNDK